MKTVKKIQQIITKLIYSANAPAHAAQKQIYRLLRLPDRFPRQPDRLYKSFTGEIRQPDRLYKSSTGQIRQPEEAIHSKKEAIRQPDLLYKLATEAIRQPDLLQIFIYLHKRAGGEAYNKVAELCIVVCRQLLQLQGSTTDCLAQYRLHADYNTSVYTNCRPP